MTRIRDIAAKLEEWSPRGSAQSYDNVGLQIGDPEREVERVLIALDFTPRVLAEAEKSRATLVITHHPLIFRPLKNLTPQTPAASLALRAAESGIALYTIHTNIDAAPSGISFALASELGLRNVSFLDPLPESLYKLVAFVPASHADEVREALGSAGAGEIGDYRNCSFALGGTGYFQPTDDADPFIGTAGGDIESVEEIRLEVEVARWNLSRVIQSLRRAHPYEEVAFDVYPLANRTTRAGLGAIGELPAAPSLSEFLQTLSERLAADTLRYVGDPDQTVRRVAVCGGSGSKLIAKALQAGADAFVTADVTYHTFFDVLDSSGKPAMALIDPGHYETEVIGEELIGNYLISHFPELEITCTRHRTSPVQSFVRSGAVV